MIECQMDEAVQATRAVQDAELQTRLLKALSEITQCVADVVTRLNVSCEARVAAAVSHARDIGACDPRFANDAWRDLLMAQRKSSALESQS